MTHHHRTLTVSAPAGQQHDWRTSTGAWLYSPAHLSWFSPVQFMHATPAQRQEYLDYQRTQFNATHFPLTACSGGWASGSDVVKPYDGRKEIPAVREACRQVLSAGLDPIVNLCDLEYYRDELGSPQKLYTFVEEMTEQIQDLVGWLITMGEIGELHLPIEVRAEINRRIRRYTDKPIGIHERVLEGPPVHEVAGFAPTIAALQFGFAADLDDCKYLIDHRLEYLTPHGCVIASYEHSIPPGHGYPGRTPTRAKSFGADMLKMGCAFDMSGGAM
jgi:hypothetical protein